MKLTILKVLALSAALGACAVSSPQLQHFQLSAGNLSVQDNGGPSIYVDAVALPDYLLRSELLLRDDEFTLQYDATKRWAEPLDLGIRRLIAQHLGSQLETRRVVVFPNPPRPDSNWRLSVDVHRFEVLGNTVVLVADGRWKSTQAAQESLHTVSFSDEIALASREGKDIAAGLSELVSQFSKELADAIAEK